jgi:AraC-like DNA-binding protein
VNPPPAREGRPAEAPPKPDADVGDGGVQEVDALSEVLRAVRLRGAVFYVVDAFAPWVVEAPSGRELTPQIMPGVQHLLEYHVVTRGSCYGGLVGRPPIELHAGDVIVFPHGDGHVMSSAPKMRGVSEGGNIDVSIGRPPFAIHVGERSLGGGDRHDELVCGFLGCDARPFNPLIAALPRVLHIRADSEPRDGVLSTLIALVVAESRSKRAGGDCVLSRISELMFVEVVRRHLQSLPQEHAGWLAGLRDPIAGRALTLLHARPARDWTLDDLARESYTSRSVLAERFKHFVGTAPMQYLAQWRMQLAAGMLAAGNANLAAIASEVGYGSEAAFSRAFKKLVGASPATWRAQSRGSAVVPDGDFGPAG